jgi:carboxymethylenebutenolidase
VSQTETLMARDGHKFSTYLAKPAGKARGAVVIVQEIFGLSPWIVRSVDSYATDGYLCVAPALFDRVRRNLVLGYSPPEREQAMGYRRQIDTAKAVLDIGAAAATVCYYGAGIPKLLPKVPVCPTMLHSGEQDQSIPLSDVELVRAAYPQANYHLYAAGHAFANDDRPDHYNAEAAALARSRTNAFLAQHIG